MSSENLPTTPSPSLSTIESAIKLIEVKKNKLKEAYDDLQANSNHLSSFSLSWPDIDSHFTAIQNAVTQRFRILESRDSAHNNQTQPQHRVDSVTDSVVTRPELVEFCKRMDGKGLRKYIFDCVKEREAIRIELPSALKSSPDPGTMVLDAMEGFYNENSMYKDDKDPGLLGLRMTCLVLLEQLMETGLSFSEQVRERAKMLALEWKARVKLVKDNSLETSAFLHLVATYSLGALIDNDELVDYIFTVAKLRQATILCRAIGLGEKIHDLIQKLLDDGKKMLAVRFIFEFGLAEKFPPVPLLDEYLKETEKLAKQVCKDGNNSLKSQNEATDKEIGALKSVIKIIEERNLETEYSQKPLRERIEQLEKEQAERKSPATPAAPKPQQQASQAAAQQAKKKKNKQSPGKQQQSANKHPKTAASFVSPSVIPPFLQARHQPAGLLPNHSAAYLSSPTIPFGLLGSTPFGLPGSTPFAGPSIPIHGLAGAPRGFPVNPNPAAPHLYNYDRLHPTYGAHGFPPQYHPPFHPR